MTAEDHFDEYYRTEGIRYYEDMTHQGFMRHAFLHGWAASKAKELEIVLGGMTEEDLRAAGIHISKARDLSVADEVSGS